MLYGLTERTAGAVKQLLADGGGVGGRATSGAAARGVTWVKVTGAAVSGWHPGVVQVADGGSLVDGTDAVQVAAGDGTALAAGHPYLCTRAEDASDDTPRFHALGSKLRQVTLTAVTAVACVGGELVVTTTTYTLTGRDLTIS